MRRLLHLTVLLVVLLAVLLAGCGHTVTVTSYAPPPTAIAPPCPQAAAGHGSMGACEPPNIKAGALGPAVTLAPSGERFPDLSNNNGLTDSQVARIGALNPLVYLKVNQGLGFIDRTFLHRAAILRANGAAVGGYDFVSCYCEAEARLFVSQLHAAGMTRTSARWAPPTLDVEYASATRGGILAMAHVITAAFGRVQIYTGNWYWAPHLGCWWPPSIQAWLAGYPSAPILCALPRPLYVAHQYSDRASNGVTGSDMSVYLVRSPSFSTYTLSVAPKPKPPRPLTRAQQHREIKRLYHRRRVLRHNLTAHRCRTVHHGQRYCRTEFAHGNAVNRHIVRLHHAGIYA